jgi:hypothetical protein
VAPGTSWTPTERITPLAPAGAAPLRDHDCLRTRDQRLTDGGTLPRGTAGRGSRAGLWSAEGQAPHENTSVRRTRPPLYGAAFPRSIQTVTGEVKAAWSVTGPAMVVWPGWSLLIRRPSHQACQRHPAHPGRGARSAPARRAPHPRTSGSSGQQGDGRQQDRGARRPQRQDGVPAGDAGPLPGFLETGFLPLHPTVVVQQARLAGADLAVSGK